MRKTRTIYIVSFGVAISLVGVVIGLLEWRDRAINYLNCRSDYISQYEAGVRDRLQHAPYDVIGKTEANDMLNGLIDLNGKMLACPGSGSTYHSIIDSPGQYKNGLVVWDGEPHGYLFKYRFVVLVNGVIEKMSEAEFLRRSKAP